MIVEQGIGGSFRNAFGDVKQQQRLLSLEQQMYRTAQIVGKGKSARATAEWLVSSMGDSYMRPDEAVEIWTRRIANERASQFKPQQRTVTPTKVRKVSYRSAVAQLRASKPKYAPGEAVHVKGPSA